VDPGRSPPALLPGIMLIATGAPLASVRKVEFTLAHNFFLSEDPIIQHHALDKVRTVRRLTARVAMVDSTTEDMAARVYAAFGFASGESLQQPRGKGCMYHRGSVVLLFQKALLTRKGGGEQEEEGRERGTRARAEETITVRQGAWEEQMRTRSIGKGEAVLEVKQTALTLEDGSSSSRPPVVIESGLKRTEVHAGRLEKAARPCAREAPEDGSAERAHSGALGRERQPQKLPAESRGEREEPEGDENEKEGSGVLRESGVVAPIYTKLEEDDTESDLDIGSPERPVVRGQQVRLTTEDFDLNN
jgi:hypothetical protein